MASNPVIAESQVALVSGASPGTAISATFTTAPSAGQLLLLAVVSGSQTGGNVIATPSGYASVGGDGSTWQVFKKIATGSEGASLSVSTVDTGGVLIASRITGADGTSPIGDFQVSASTLVAPSVSPPSANSLLIQYLFGSAASAATPPVGLTLIGGNGMTNKNGGPLGLTAAYENLTASGSTGSATWTSGGVGKQAISIVISPLTSSPASRLLELRRKLLLQG